MGNFLGTSKDMRYKIRQNFDLISLINEVILSVNQRDVLMHKAFGKNYIWVANLLATDGS